MADRAERTATSFGELLRRARKAAGLTQEELAERASLSRRGINDLERGVRQTPRKDTITLLAQALDLSDEERTDFEAAARARRGAGPPAPASSAAGQDESPAPSLPTGTVTFLFTDLESSTRLLQQLGSSRYAALRDIHHRLLRAACAAHDGHEVDTAGDSFFFAFPTAGEAAAAAVEAQQAIASQPWPEGVTVRVRMGLHTGTPLVAGDHYVGLDVHRAARIAAAGHGGQVLLSESTHALLEPDLPHGVVLRDLLAHRFKDLQRPEHLWQLVLPDVPGLAADFSTLDTLEAHPHNLPLQPTPLIGREREVAAVCALLQREDVRLVTLTGTGGTGKTRLALQAAAELVEAFRDGVWFIGLSRLIDPELVLPTIAQTLDIREEPGRPLLQRLVERLQQPVLLLLDNFEQVVSAAVQVADLLAACPGLKVLVTSRTVLRVQAEHEFLVPPLALPPLIRTLEGEALVQYAAVALFLERVRAFKPDFQLTESNARPVAEICVRLDGLPLALELAAARVRLLPPQALLIRLAHGLAVLTGGARDVPLRQQTLRNTLTWSYDLLSADEQVLFRQLATFVGGCTLEAVEALVKGTDNAHLEVFNTISALLENNLIQESEQEGEEPRFLMLQTVREYGLEILAATGELEINRTAHAHYFLALVEQAQLELHSPKQAIWLKRLEQEHDNLRAVLEWALETVAGERATERRELALRFSAALWEFWRINGHYAEGRTFLDRALALGEGEDGSLRAKVLRAAANLALWQGDYARAEDLGQQALALYQERGDTHGLINSLFLLGGIAWRRGKIVEALAIYEERVRLMRHIGKPWETGQALFYLADLTSTHGEYARGQALFQEALVLFQKADDDLWVGATLVHSALWLFFSRGDPAILRQRLHEGEVLITKVGNQHWIAESSWIEAGVALYAGELVRAASLAKESLAIFREMGSAWFIAFTLTLLGRVETQRGELTAARSAYQESLVLCRDQGEQSIVPFTLEGLAELVATQGELGWAANLWGAAEALREAIAFPLPPVLRAGNAQAVATARAQLGELAFAAAWQAGRAMTLEQVVAAQGAAARHTLPPI